MLSGTRLFVSYRDILSRILHVFYVPSPLFIKSKNTVDRDLKMQMFLILVIKASLLSY